MAIRSVPSVFATIADAIAASLPGDIIQIAAGYGPEFVVVSVNNLTFDGPATVTGIDLFADVAVTQITLTGAAPINIIGSGTDETFTGNTGANVIDAGFGNDTVSGGGGADTIMTTGDGTDTLSGGAGNDLFQILAGENGNGTIDGGTETDTVQTSDLGGFTFTNVEVLDVTTVTGSIAQFSSFASIIDSTAGSTEIAINLRGAGGTIDFTSRLAGTDRIRLEDGGLLSGITVTGSINGDTLNGTAFDDTLNGGAGADTINDISGGDTDTLSGGAGNDIFVLNGGESAAGSVNGGTETDTVRSSDLGSYTFSAVEALDTQAITASIAQMASFASLLDSNAASTQIQVALRGAGGTLDFTTRITGTDRVRISDSGLLAGITVTGSVNGDELNGTTFDDTLNGGAGSDTINDASGGDTDAIAGGAGNDLVVLSGGESASGTVDGGTETDTVKSSDLGGYAFTTVEVLDTPFVSATVAQLSAFGSLIDSSTLSTQIQIGLRGAGGTIDFTSRVTGTDRVRVSDSALTAGVTVTGSVNGDELNSTTFNDVLNGGAGADTINDTTGGDIDTLTGGAGNDLFVLTGGQSAGGTVDGGTETDTVKSSDLGGYTFTTVEVLDTPSVTASTAQLAAFASLTDSTSASTQFQISLRGAAGAIDFTSRVTGSDRVRVTDAALTGGITVTGSVNGDELNSTAFNDTLNGGAGADTINDVTGGDFDALNGGAGNDLFVLNGGQSMLGTVDGGTETDTVRSSDLGGYAFTTVEILDTPSVTGSITQLAAFASLTDTTSSSTQFQIGLRGAAGAIDFTSRVTGSDRVRVTDSGLVGGMTVTGSVNGDELNSTTFNDVLNGGAGTDTIIDGTGGDFDALNGGGGNDLFLLTAGPSMAGTVDGGTETDTVRSSDLGGYTFTTVEVLDTSSVTATTAQLAAFASLTDTTSASTQFDIALRGAGGTIDFTSRVSGTDRVRVNDGGLTTGVTVTGSINGDELNSTAFNDVLNGGAGADTINDSAGGDIDTLNGGAGNDLFRLNGGPSATGTVDGGTETDTVQSSDLGGYAFTTVEALDTSFVIASAAQINAFASLIDSAGASTQFQIGLRGAGGTIDFTTRVSGTDRVNVFNNSVTSGITITGSINNDDLESTQFNDTLNGGAGADRISDTSSGDFDIFTGGSGNDIFTLSGGQGAGGTVDGGTETDIVRSFDLGGFTFTNVESLDTTSVIGSTAQFASFTSLNDITASTTQFQIGLRGAGGTIDFTSRVTGTDSVNVSNSGLTAGVTVTGSNNGDQLSGSAFNDTLNGGAGADTITDSTGGDVDTLGGGAGNDLFSLSGGQSASGTVDGGTEIDRVSSDDLGGYTFTNVEVLDTDFVAATIAQLSSFASIVDNGAPSTEVDIFLRGAGGTIDFTSRVTGTDRVHVQQFGSNGLTAGVTVTGTVNADILSGSSFNDTLNGGAGADILDDATGGDSDTLNGGAGNDMIYLSGGASASGAVDGGTEADTVRSSHLGNYTFTGVETLDTNSVSASTAQLASFASIIDSFALSTQIQVSLRGAGGTIDFTSRIAGTDRVRVEAGSVTAGLTVTGSVNGDELYSSNFNDTLNGGAGTDTIIDSTSGETDTLNGGAGNDVFQLDGGSNATGTVDGGTEIDTVRSGNLGGYTFTGVEALDTTNVQATAAQLSSFASIIDSSALSTQFDIFLRGAGGVIDFSTRVLGSDRVRVQEVFLNPLTAGVTITGSANADVLNGSNFNDTLNGGGGLDTLVDNSAADVDALNGGAGNDLILLNGGSSANGTVDGGTETDTVRSFNLGGYVFTGVEILDTPTVSATASQLASFASIVDNTALSTQFAITLRGAGGTIDFSTRVTGTDSVNVSSLSLTGPATVTGTANADVLGSSTFGDTLNGGAGADLFVLNGGNTTAGTVNGGTESDTVRSNNLGAYAFTAVEVLDTNNLRATIAQLAAFGTIIDSVALNTQFEFSLRGAGGVIDFTSRIAGTDRISVIDDGLTSGVTITGSVNGDILRTSTFNDTLNGGAGADSILDSGGGDTDTLTGGAGNDLFHLTGGASAGGTIDGGTETDTVLSGNLGLYALSNVEVLDTANVSATVAQLGSFGSIVDSSAVGTQIVFNLRGLGGTLDFSTRVGPTDSVRVVNTGLTSGVTLTGTANADVLAGSAFTDTLTGGNGNDDYFVDNATDVIIETGANNSTDRVFASVSYTLAAAAAIDWLATSNDLGTTAINLIGNGFAQRLNGNNGNNILVGGAGSDIMTGNGGNDDYYVDAAGDQVIEAGANNSIDRVFASTTYTLAAGQAIDVLATTNAAATTAINLSGNAFDQTITGNAGVNVLNGSGGIDIMSGLDGADDYLVDNAADQVIETGAGNTTDRVYASTSYTLAAAAAIDFLTTSSQAGTVAINLTGNGFSQTVNGNNGVNFLRGEGGNDTVLGQGGNDRIYGGLGNDTLNGGTELDTFVFDTVLNAATNVDTIQAYSIADDVIWLDDSVFAGLALGTLAAAAFTTGAAASAATHRIIYNNVSGALSFDADGNGAGAAVQFASIGAGLALNQNEFVVI